MNKDYINSIHGTYRISGTRVSLDSVVYAFLGGQSPESIVDSFPVLSLEQVYGAITYYLANQAEVDAYLQQGEIDFAALHQRLQEKNHLLHQKLIAFRQQKEPLANETELTHP